MEETATHNTKVSDSAYSNSCNSQSQHSGSSKSRHSISSGSSSGYCGHPSTLSSGNEPFPQPTVSKRNKDKEHKKKKQKTCTTSSTSSTPAPDAAPSRPSQAGSVSTSDNVDRSDCSISSGNNVALGGSGALGVGLGGATIPGPENEALQIATISQTLNCIQKLNAMELPEVVPEENEGQTASAEAPLVDEKEEQLLTCLQIEQNIESTDPTEFCAIVSMHDGVVMHTSASLTQVLGFPKDMWLGRSFIDFLHASDRIPFASHITSGVAIPFTSSSDNTVQGNKNSFFCRLRCYRGLKSTGFGVTEKKVTYLPFHLSLAFRELEHSTANVKGSLQTIILVVNAKRVQTIYKSSEETRVSPKFVTKHLPTCQLSFVDPEVVPHFGYLPQDMINHSVMDFYHPEDLPFLKEVYEAVMKEKGSLFRSKPYRFRTQNGDFLLLETEWSSFINPWTRKLEFVIGQHRVLKGPVNPDVFAPPREDEMLQISEEVLKESKIIEDEIKCLLLKPISRTTESVRQQVSKRCKDLANFMDTLMDEITKPKLKLDLPQEETSFSERDSVMLGEISPHHDYYDSKSLSETPPSYNQLNYNENIQRFFESKPKTTVSDESSESKMEANQSLPSTDEEGKSVPVADSSLGSTTATNRKCRSPVNGSGSGSGSGFSGSGGVTGSAGSHGDTSQTNTNSNRSYRPHHLTEALLYRHNEDMEKKMVQKHREQRSKGGDRENKIKKSTHEKFQEQCQGLKRSGSHSWEGEHFKATKHSHIVGNLCSKETMPGALPTAGVGTTAVNNIEKPYAPVTNSRNITPVFQGSGNVNLWPPFSVSVTPFNHTQPCSTPGGYSAGNLNSQPPPLGNMIPVYYIPSQPSQQAGMVQSDAPSTSHTTPPRIPTQLPIIPQQVPYVSGIPGLAYYPIHPVYGGPVVYPSMTMIQPTSVLPATPVNPHKMEKAETAHIGMSKFQRPASQATSVKAEPGSAMGSIASASVKRCMSECSKKELALFSPEGRTSPNVSQDETKAKILDERNNENNYSVMRDTEDDSCFSSFYSFLKTEKSDESMTSGPEDSKTYNFAKEKEENVWEAMDTQDRSSAARGTPVLQEPPWLEQVTVTPDLVYRYQLNTRSLEDILDSDRKALMSTRQPILVNDQLSQFYIDMELEGLATKLMLDEGLTTSSSSGDDSPAEAVVSCRLSKNKKKRRSVEYGKITIIFEENAPLPPPIEAK